MSQEDQIRWDEKHAQGYGAQEPSPFLVEVLNSSAWEIPPGRALDIACGSGRNALFLAARGFEVTAVDISAVALAEARRRAEAASLAVSWQIADLAEAKFPRERFDLVINFNYLQRTLIPKIVSALRVGGHVIFETYLTDQKEIGHPKNPAYLLGHNELLDLFRPFRVLWYREGNFADGRESSFRAGIFARKLP
jgi:tellurite methyltransferase